MDTTRSKDAELIVALGGPSKVANMLGCSVQRVFNWMRRGIPSAVRLRHIDIFGPLPKDEKAA